MTESNNISELEGPVYFLGIGGIGMSALARYFNSRGFKVSGYDKTPTVLTKQLEGEGIRIHYSDDVNLLDKDAKFVVYTPAIPATHAQLNYYQKEQYRLLKRSEVLGIITRGNFNICVAGTHGKTTTSAMVAHILTDSGFGCNAFLGGIASNYDSNFWSHSKKVCVVEADEYDRSFLQLNPDVAVITATDADHLDIYGTEEKMQDAFVSFTQRIKSGGTLLSKYGLGRANDFSASNKMTYGTHDNNADIYAKNISIKNGCYRFDLSVKDKVISNVALNMGGEHNIENVIAAIAVAMELDIEELKIKKAVASFAGVKRRFEYIIKTEDMVMIDDYAHHPEELRTLISSAKHLFPGKTCTVVFQPHLYSRTKDLADGFAEVLSMADEVILLPIYPARELPMEGVTSQLILDKITLDKKSIKQKEELLGWVESNKTDLLITSGAGDIDTLVEPLKQILIKRN